jgi:hypothetical protein
MVATGGLTELLDRFGEPTLEKLFLTLTSEPEQA